MSRWLHLGDFHPQLESSFVHRLRSTIERGDARPLLVVVPNRLLGVHLRRRAAALGSATVGLRPRALDDQIARWAEPLVRERRLRDLPDWALSALLAEIAPPAATEGRRSEGFYRALAGTLRDLRDAGVPAAALARVLASSGSRSKRSETKGGAAGEAAGEAPWSEAGRARTAQVATALAALERAIERRRLVDGARRSALAVEALAGGALEARRVWIYGFYELVARQQSVLETLLEKAAPEVEFEVFFPWPGAAEGTVAEYARPLRQWFEERGFRVASEASVAPTTPPADDLFLARRAFSRRTELIPAAALALPFSGDGSLWAIRASSAPLEALDLLRVAECARPGESVGILPRHEEILQELALSAVRAGRGVHRLPAESPRRRPLGRAVLALLDLAAERLGDAQREGALPRSGVEELLVSGGVTAERFAPGSRPELWTQAMRRRGLVGGLAAWNRFLERSGPQARLFEPTEDDEERLPELQRELPSIARFVVELLDDLRRLGQEKKRWSERSRRFVDLAERWLVPGADRDALVESVLQLGDLDGVLTPSWRHFRAAVEHLLDHGVVGELRFGDGPTIAPLSSVRGVTFDVLLLPRLVEKGFPRVGREDPFLPDEDRAQVSRRLADAEPRPAAGLLSPKRARVRAEEAFLFQLALGMARRSVVLSWPTRGEDGGVVVPSSFLLDLARPAAGRETTYEDLRSASLLPTAPREVVDRPILGSEWDLRRLEEVESKRRPPGALAAWFEVHPRLRSSLAADRARRHGEITGLEDRLTEFDGLVGADLVSAWWQRSPMGADSLRSHSPSALEDYAGCGFRFLWKRVLRTHGEPPPERTLDLEPREIGSLVHDVLRELFQGLGRERLLPLSPTALGPARSRLAPILDRLVSHQPGRIGEGPVALWQARRRRILEDLEEFLEREVAAVEKWRPAELEVAFGEPQPLVIEIGGQRLAVRGRIDRIDEKPGAVRIVDYKSGRLSEASEQPGSIAGGQRLQLPLYRLALERWRGERRPVHGALLGVTSKSEFRRVEWAPAHFDQAAEQLGRAVHGIVSGIDAGEFFQVERDRFCDAVCEWSSVCGPGRRRAISAKRDDPRVVAAEAWRAERPAEDEA